MHAFWPFFIQADAAVNSPVPGSKTPVLAAAINVDPNPLKDDLEYTRMQSGNALIAGSGPVGTAVANSHIPPPNRISVYVVRPGDTLSDIADMFGVSINTILWMNNIKNVRDVHPGDTLVILPISGVEHTVVKGDTLKSLAKKYSGDVEEIAQYNNINPLEALVVGSAIVIPGGEIALPPSPKSSSPLKISKEPYLGGAVSVQSGYYTNPLPGWNLNQGLHGWNGVDLGGHGVRGAPVLAAAAGTVIVARGSGWNGGYGNYIVIAHTNGSQTLYSHMQSVSVSSGESVSSGQVIGSVGSSGKSTGAHLHFEVRGAANPFRTCSIGSVCSPK